MSLPILLLQPSGSRDRTGSVTVTPSESVDVRDGAWWLIEGTTNLHTNPIAAENDTGYASSEFVHKTRIEDANCVLPDGQVVNTGVRWTWVDTFKNGLTTGGVDVSGIAGGALLSASAMFRSAKEGVDSAMMIYQPPNKSSTLIIGEEWQVIKVEGLPRSDSVSVALLPHLRGGNGVAGDVLEVTALQVEAKPYATPFTVGTRVPGTLSAPISQPLGDIVIRYREDGIEQTERIPGPGRFGQHGIVWQENGQIVVTTDRQVDVVWLLAYPSEAVASVYGSDARSGDIVLSEANVDVDESAITLWRGLDI